MAKLSSNKKRIEKEAEKQWEKPVLNVANMLAVNNGCTVLRCAVGVTGSTEGKSCTNKENCEKREINSPQTKMNIEINEIHVMDCLNLMKDMKDNFVDLTITSPPYDDLRNYNGYSFEFEKIAQELFRITKEGGVVVWVVGDRINGGYSMTSFKQALFFKQAGFQVHDIMIYRKKNTPFMRKGAYTNCYEFMFILSKGKPKTFNPLKEKTVRSGYELMPYSKKADGINKKQMGKLNDEKVRTNIWNYAVGLGGTTKDKIAFKHPAVFPEKLAEDHILSWSNEGDLVFDPMCGSGTTCKMAKLHRRNYIGCDISEEYCKIAQERIKMVENSQKKLFDKEN